ncbi:uncharacterized protein [Nicotiana sylvestris]|uniref:uncharacterized protein n=1 Tax=Nicotiana sylvestris TaxID=4096 RepID=UPI00388C6048
MIAPPGNQEGQSTARPLLFNGQYYSWWKNRIRDHIIEEYYELWDIVTDGPLATIKKNAEGVDESKNIATLKLDELIGNLTAYEVRRQTMKMDAPRKERRLALRIAEGSDLEDDEMAMITRDFKKKKEQVQPGRNKGSTKAMVAAWGEISDDDLEDEAGDKQTLMAIGESDDEQEVGIPHLKDKIKFLSKQRLCELFLDFIDESEIINNEKEDLFTECVILKANCKNLESRDNESKSKNAELKNQVLELDASILEHRSENLKLKLGTGKKKADHTHLTLEESLGKIKDELYKKDEQIKVLKEDLGKVKHELDRTCKWNMTSDALSWYKNIIVATKEDLAMELKHLSGILKASISLFLRTKSTHIVVQVKGSSQIWWLEIQPDQYVTTV